MSIIQLRNRDINSDAIEEIFWSIYGDKVVGCHIYYRSGRCLDLSQIEAQIVYNYRRNNNKDTDKRNTVVTGSLKERSLF